MKASSQGENNWNACIQQMAEAFRLINGDFSGQWSTEQRAVEDCFASGAYGSYWTVQETRTEKLKDALYHATWHKSLWRKRQGDWWAFGSGLFAQYTHRQGTERSE